MHQTNHWAPMGPDGPHGGPMGPMGPHGGPWPHTHFGVPASARTISDGRVGTTIRMAKGMWFLRLLLEWPGFATFSYSVIQCTAAVSLPGTWFLQESLFWGNRICFCEHSCFSRKIHWNPWAHWAHHSENHAKRLCFGSAARTHPPKWWVTLCRGLEAYLAPESIGLCRGLVGQNARN